MGRLRFKPALMLALGCVVAMGLHVARAAPGDSELISIGPNGLAVGGDPRGISTFGRYALHTRRDPSQAWLRDRVAAVNLPVTVNSTTCQAMVRTTTTR